MLLSNVYQQNLIGFVVDEAHCINGHSARNGSGVHYA